MYVPSLLGVMMRMIDTMDSARDGKNLGVFQLVAGLKAGYNLSTPLAYFLAIGGFVLLHRLRKFDLHYIGRHGYVEHDASLVHHNTPAGEKFAPIAVDHELVDALIADVKAVNKAGEGSTIMDAVDVARARVRREKESPPLGAKSAEIARGEMGIILGVMETQAGTKKGVPVEWMREWIEHERLPKDWKPTHVQGLFDVVHRSKAIRTAMDELRKAEADQPIQEKPKA
ncbi:hypothetical protein H0H81_001363 [Sphagnurus paluster]|uniref:Heme haloperoxidase family profile domain-containing protein n=1 Tax=Sphagnurus paluster TaxID=117069 RepID=A0A9P7FQZ4_9AGAR|nr:hypothetical protein H0H81_001363 [Sphagnurus paluster]